MNVGTEVHKVVRKLTPKSNRVRFTAAQALRATLLVSVLLNVLFIPINVTPSLALAAASQSVNVWWPSNGAHVQGTQPFKAMVEGLDVASYDMYWQVDGGGLVQMDNNSTDYPHKEAQVDLSGWSWHGSGPYTVTFVAKQGGAVIAQSDIQLYIDNGLPANQSVPAQSAPATQTTQTAPVTQTASTPATQPAASTLVIQSSKDPSKKLSIDVSGLNVTSVSDLSLSLQSTATTQTVNQALVPAPAASGLYVDPNSNAAKQAAAWRTSRPADASKMDTLASQPTAAWFGGWNSNIQGDAAQYVDAAAAAGKTALLVAYNIPNRDCGGYSSGGAATKDDYLNWIGGMARGIGGRSASVILEPDALPGLDCLSPADQDARMSMLASAVSILKANGNTRVYLDAGNSTWKSAADMAPRLQRAGINQADGFSLNVSGFEPTDTTVSFGEQLSSLVGGKHFVIDTSRNGNGSNGQWCNPAGRAIGNKPTLQTGNSLVDAFLWVKTPGESDGTCNGGPSAGTWWPEYALSLVP